MYVIVGFKGVRKKEQPRIVEPISGLSVTGRFFKNERCSGQGLSHAAGPKLDKFQADANDPAFILMHTTDCFLFY